MEMRKKTSPIPVIIACLIVQLCVGILYLWSVFRNPIIATFGMSVANATMVSSYNIFAFTFGNLLGGILLDRKGPKITAIIGVVLFSLGIFLTGCLSSKTIGLINLTYCVMGGLGTGFAYGACLNCLQKWMPHKRGLASGLAVCAFGLSTVLFSPFCSFLMKCFKTGDATIVTGDATVATITTNFHGVFFIMAAIFIVFGLGSCLIIKLPSEEYIASLNLPAAQTTDAKSYTLGQAIKTVPFWALVASMFFINGVWNVTLPLIKSLGMQRGLTDAAATLAVSVTGITNAAGRLIMAALSDKIGRVTSIIILSAITVVGGLLMTFVGGVPFAIVVAVLAFAFGGPSSIHAAMSTDFFGPKYSGTNYGVIMLMLGVSSIFFNFLSQTVMGGRVIPTFIVTAICAVVPILAMIAIKINQKKKQA